MQTLYETMSVPGATNIVTTAVLIPWSVRVTLNSVPQVVTQVELPSATRGLRLWVSDSSVWYALDDPPAPITAPILDPVVPSTAFHYGALLLPGDWTSFNVPGDSQNHTLYLVSESSSPTVLVEALLEAL